MAVVLIFSLGCLVSNTPLPSGDGGLSGSVSMLPSSRGTDHTKQLLALSPGTLVQDIHGGVGLLVLGQQGRP